MDKKGTLINIKPNLMKIIRYF